MSKGRMEGLNGRSGLWVKWRFEGESDWHGPKELLKNGRKPPESPSISHQHLGRITQSRLLKPYRIELSFWEGEEGEMLTSYKEGKRRGGLESMAMVDFYARSNHPNLRWPMDVINMIRNRRDLIDLSFQDAYECFLHCK
ncbi:MAG: hypothetical protein IIZ54_09850, partial [Selenomonadaceae bacterium]|nr:hypothetical protein [Selenomonadaceae bacterium]